MRKLLLLTTILLLCFHSFSQSTTNKQYYLKLSGGRVLFGTGDVSGPSVGVEGSKNVLKQTKKGVSRLLLGTELTFETGVRNVEAVNPTQQDLLRSFYHISNLLLYPKMTYYPFGGIVRGFNLAIGPSFGYSLQSHEAGWMGRPLSNGDYIRYSVLTHSDTWLLGYRISAGYDVGITKKLLTGIRLDFSSYSNGDINTLVALKTGIRW